MDLTEKGVISLLKKHRKQFVNALVSNGEIPPHQREDVETLISNIQVEEEVDNFLEKYNEFFPKKYQSSQRTLRERFDKFHSLFPGNSKQEILEAAEAWNIEKYPPFCGKAIYFLYKYDKGVLHSRCEDKILELKSQSHDRSNYGESLS